MWKKIFLATILIGNIFSSNVHAEIKTYTGEGFFIVMDETLDVAKEKAKADGERNVAEQVYVYVESQSKVKNSELAHDEIIVMTESLMKVLDVKYKIEPAEDDSFAVRASVTAEIDTDEIDKLIKKIDAQKNFG